MEQDFVYRPKWESITCSFIERRRTRLGRIIASFLVIWSYGVITVVGEIADLPQDFARYHSEALPRFMKICHIISSLIAVVAAIAITFTVWIFMSLILALCASFST